jgi:iron uptake system component EfeO
MPASFRLNGTMAARQPDRRTKPAVPGGIVRLVALVVMAAVLLVSTGCHGDNAGGPPDATMAASPASGASATPSPSASTDPRLALAVRSYRGYLRQQADALHARTRPFTDAIRAGDVAAAKKRFASSRICWERIQSVAILLPQIDRRIDARADDFATPTDPAWTGWHRLEQMLWIEDSTAGAASLANRLDRDLGLLQQTIPTLPITPKLMAAGIARLVEEAIAEKLPGAEDRYSRLDLADLAGNLQGAEAGYSAARPVLTVGGAAVTTRLLDGQFSSVNRILSKYRTSAGYRPYPALTAGDRALLQARLSELADTLTRLSAVFGQ